MREWKPIAQAKHEIENRIIATNGFSVVICYWDGERWRNERSAFMGSNYRPTHFIKLPELPRSQ